MNPSLELVSDEIKLFLAELHRKFDEFDARMERRFARTMAALEQRTPLTTGVIPAAPFEARVVADNWGGEFEQGDSSSPLLVVDNWGGLFEQGDPSSSHSSSIIDEPYDIVDSPICDSSETWDAREQRKAVAVLGVGALDNQEGAALSAASASSLGLSAETPLNHGGRLAFMYEHPGLEAYDVAYATAVRELPVLLDRDSQVRSTGNKLDTPRDPRSRVRGPLRPPHPVPRKFVFLMELLASPSAFRSTAASARHLFSTGGAPDRIRNPCAEDDGADDPVDPGPKFASLTSFRIRGGPKVADLFQKLGLNGAEDIAIHHGFQLPESGGTLHRFEHHVPAAAFLPKLHGGTYSTARRSIRVRDDVLLAASEVLAQQATKEHSAMANDLDFASRLPRPDYFVKDAESGMYTPTNCSTQVLNGTNDVLNSTNDYRTNRILHHTIGVPVPDAAGFMVVEFQSVVGSTRASPYSLSPHTGVWFASQDVPKQIKSGSIAPIVVAMASSPAAVGTQSVFSGMPSRYIINLNLAYSVDVVLTCSASEPYVVQKVFVGLLVENQVHLASIRDTLLSCGLDKSRIVWDPGAQPLSFLCSHSVDSFKIYYSLALQLGWQLRNANCSNHNLWCTCSSSLRQHQHGVWLSACCVQVYQLQSLLVDTSANSKTSAVIYDDMKTWLELNLTSVVALGKLLTPTSSLRTKSTATTILQQPWPPPVILYAHINNELVETYLVASQLLVLDHVVVATVQLEIMSTGAKLRPTPWPSFSSRFHHVAVDFSSMTVNCVHTSLGAQSVVHLVTPISQIVDVFGQQITDTSVWPMDLAWLVCSFTPASRRQKRAGGSGHGLHSEQEFPQFLWDLGGSIPLHRLGGKPNLKERGMSAITPWVFWWIHIAAMLPVVGQRFGIVTCSILPQLHWMSFDPGPSIKLEPHYISKGNSLQYTLFLFLDSGSIQRVLHIVSDMFTELCSCYDDSHHKCTIVLSVLSKWTRICACQAIICTWKGLDIWIGTL